MLREDFELAFYYVGYFIYLIASVATFWLFLSGKFDPFFSLCLLIVSLVGLIVIALKLLEDKERIREVSEVIIPKKIRRRLKMIHNRFFKEGYV